MKLSQYGYKMREVKAHCMTMAEVKEMVLQQAHHYER